MVYGILYEAEGVLVMQVWHYDDGIAVAIGHGHSGRVNSLDISPDKRLLVSAGSEGSIFIWSMPSTGALRAVLEEDAQREYV
jgi:WD40 repeat protein